MAFGGFASSGLPLFLSFICADSEVTWCEPCLHECIRDCSDNDDDAIKSLEYCGVLCPCSIAA